jgi:hypothetical protein
MLLAWWLLAAEAQEANDPARLGACLGQVVAVNQPSAGALSFECNGWPVRQFPTPTGRSIPAEIKPGLRGILVWDEAAPHSWTRLQVIDGLAWAPVGGAAAGPVVTLPSASGGCAGVVVAASPQGLLDVSCDGIGTVRLPAAGGGRLPPGIAIGARAQVTWEASSWTMVLLADGTFVKPWPVVNEAEADVF